jgi:hypothetical protein
MIHDPVLKELVEKQTSYFDNQMVSEDTRVAVFQEIQKRQAELKDLYKD